MSDATARLSGNVPLQVQDKRLMDVGISDRVRLICHLRKTPNLLSGLFLESVRAFYSDSDNLPIDVCKPWSPDPRQTQIWIDTAYAYNDANPEFRPLIYVKLSPLQYRSTTGQPDSVVGMDLREAEYHFEREGKGQVEFVHLGSTADETAVLVGATLDYFDAMAYVMKQDFNFKALEVVSASGMDEIKTEDRDRFKGTVALGFVFTDTFTLKRESPKLKRVIWRLGEGLGKFL